MAKKRKAAKAKKARKPARKSAPRKQADEGFFASFMKLFGPPETGRRK